MYYYFSEKIKLGLSYELSAAKSYFLWKIQKKKKKKKNQISPDAVVICTLRINHLSFSPKRISLREDYSIFGDKTNFTHSIYNLKFFGLCQPYTIAAINSLSPFSKLQTY